MTKETFEDNLVKMACMRLEKQKKGKMYKETLELFREYDKTHPVTIKTDTSTSILKLFPLIKYLISTAACIAIIFGCWHFLKAPAPNALANEYFKEEFLVLPITIGNKVNNLQDGIEAYNNKQFEKAELIFLEESKKSNATEAIKYLGILYLRNNEYEKALDQFEQLSADQTLQINHGPFLQALTYMKRDQKGDHQKAKKLLQQIINQDLQGKKKAEKWIKLLK